MLATLPAAFDDSGMAVLAASSASPCFETAGQQRCPMPRLSLHLLMSFDKLPLCTNQRVSERKAQALKLAMLSHVSCRTDEV